MFEILIQSCKKKSQSVYKYSNYMMTDLHIAPFAEATVHQIITCLGRKRSLGKSYEPKWWMVKGIHVE